MTSSYSGGGISRTCSVGREGSTTCSYGGGSEFPGLIKAKSSGRTNVGSSSALGNKNYTRVTIGCDVNDDDDDDDDDDNVLLLMLFLQ